MGLLGWFAGSAAFFMNKTITFSKYLELVQHHLGKDIEPHIQIELEFIDKYGKFTIIGKDDFAMIEAGPEYYFRTGESTFEPADLPEYAKDLKDEADFFLTVIRG